MAIQIKLTAGLAALVVVLVIGYIIALMSFIESSPKLQSALETKMEKMTLQLHTWKAECATKDLKIKSLTQLLNHGTTTKEIVAPIPEVLNTVVSKVRGHRQGVIILGMHRSGTSILGGLMNKMGLKTGGPLIQAAEDNAKGFFERIDVVLQNDNFMSRQNCHYGGNTYLYDAFKGLESYFAELNNPQFFSEGTRALTFLNNKDNYPWMLKDPRLCITFRTWIPFLKAVPAILFTYRHPFDVAMSLHTRYEQYKIIRGLKLWYVYNKRAVQQSADLCLVTTSHHIIMKDPHNELKRIRKELIECGVDVPHDVTKAAVSEFIDEKLQHGKSTLKDKSCEGDLSTMKPPEAWPTDDFAHIKLYREVMRVYCAFEDGSAYSVDFPWDESIKDSPPW